MIIILNYLLLLNERQPLSHYFCEKSSLTLTREFGIILTENDYHL